MLLLNTGMQMWRIFESASLLRVWKKEWDRLDLPYPWREWQLDGGIVEDIASCHTRSLDVNAKYKWLLLVSVMIVWNFRFSGLKLNKLVKFSQIRAKWDVIRDPQTVLSQILAKSFLHFDICFCFYIYSELFVVNKTLFVLFATRLKNAVVYNVIPRVTKLFIFMDLSLIDSVNKLPLLDPLDHRCSNPIQLVNWSFPNIHS